MKTTLVAFSFIFISVFLFVKCAKDEVSDGLIYPDVPLEIDSVLTGVCTELIPDEFSRAFGPSHLFWNKKLLKVRFLGGSSYVRNKIITYANEWSRYADITFDFVEQEPSDIRVSFDRNDGSWSYVGQTSNYISSSSATMNFGWFSDRTSDREFRRTTLHEFGHALGLSHEHQHPNVSIDWNVSAVYAYYARTQDWSRSEVNSNIFKKYSTATTNFSGYDPQSIMHYYIPASLVNGSWTASSNTELSAIDKLFISKIYPGANDDEPEAEDCSCPASRIILACEDFEQYTQGTFENDKAWSPWVQNGSMGELQTYTWGRVLKLEYDRADNPDVLFSPKFLKSSVVNVTWDMYVGETNSAYFNIQKLSTPGDEFGAQFYFYDNSVGAIKINGRDVEFNYDQEKWLEINLSLDFESGLVGFSIDKDLVAKWPMSWTARNGDGSDGFSALNFYAIDENARFWLDDFCIGDASNEVVSSDMAMLID